MPLGVPAHKVLIVADDPEIARDMEAAFQNLGVQVVGPAASADTALALAREGIDAAVLDLHLREGPPFLVAEHLHDQDVPFVFLSSGGSAIPARFAHIRHCTRPVDAHTLAHTLLEAVIAGQRAAAGMQPGYAIRRDGTVWRWKVWNDSGELASGTAPTDVAARAAAILAAWRHINQA